MSYQLGIDLGTTFTAAAIADGAGVRMADLTHDSVAIPSVLTRTSDGIAVGAEALSVAATRPWLVAREFKRRFGDDTPFIIGDDRWTASELTGLLYEWVVDRVSQIEGEEPSRVVVTHPATWSAHRLGLLREATSRRSAPVGFLPEPSAAAVHYHERARMEPGATIGVYDLGGGTFDATVIRRSETGYEILGRPTGLDQLGGLDFDQVVFDLVMETMPSVFDELDPDDVGVQRAVARLREECTRAKIGLSFDARTTVPVVLPGVATDVLISRSDFEERIEPYVTSTIATLAETIHTADLANDDLDAVLLVGGSSRVPMVAERLFNALGISVVVDTHPKYAVAKGAVLSDDRAATEASESGPSDQSATDVEPFLMPNVTVDISAIVASMAAPRLVVVSGPNAGTASALDEGSTTVGRSGDRVDVVVPDPAASRVHLRIDRNGNELRLTDLGSTTGTKVDRVPVDGTVEVTSGSLIEMGSTWLFVDDPMRRVATPGAVVIDLAEAATPVTGGRPGHGWATLGFGGDPLGPVHVQLARLTTDLAISGRLGEDLLRSIIVELLVLDRTLPLAVLSTNAAPLAVGGLTIYGSPSDVPSEVLEHGVLVVLPEGFGPDELLALRSSGRGQGGTLWLHDPPAAWPAADQRIALDPASASIEVASAAGRSVVEVPATLGEGAAAALVVSRPTPSP